MSFALLLKALMGAGIVVGIDLVSRTKYAFLAGMLPLFPAFMLISHYLVFKNNPAKFSNTVLFGMCSLIPYLIYLAAVLGLHKKMTIGLTLTLGTAVWLTAASVLVLIWNRAFPA